MADQFRKLVDIRLDHVGGGLDRSGQRLAASVQDDPAAARLEPHCDVTIKRGCNIRRQATREHEHLRSPLGQRIDRCKHFVDLLGLDSKAWKVDVGNLVAHVVDDLDVAAGAFGDYKRPGTNIGAPGLEESRVKPGEHGTGVEWIPDGSPERGDAYPSQLGNVPNRKWLSVPRSRRPAGTSAFGTRAGRGYSGYSC